jgi:small-conductance mechanosensitive channel
MIAKRLARTAVANFQKKTRRVRRREWLDLLGVMVGITLIVVAILGNVLGLPAGLAPIMAIIGIAGGFWSSVDLRCSR